MKRVKELEKMIDRLHKRCEVLYDRLPKKKKD